MLIIFVQNPADAEDLGKRWQTLVADIALRAKEGEQVFHAVTFADANNLCAKEGEQVADAVFLMLILLMLMLC